MAQPRTAGSKKPFWMSFLVLECTALAGYVAGRLDALSTWWWWPLLAVLIIIVSIRVSQHIESLLERVAQDTQGQMNGLFEDAIMEAKKLHPDGPKTKVA